MEKKKKKKRIIFMSQNRAFQPYFILNLDFQICLYIFVCFMSVFDVFLILRKYNHTKPNTEEGKEGGEEDEGDDDQLYTRTAIYFFSAFC